MIISIGVDIVEIKEIKQSIQESKRFLKRVFTEEEIQYCEKKQNKWQSYAARFAAKEATMKALGTGWDEGVQWDQIIIKNNEKGKPVIVLAGKAYEMADALNVISIHVSLSHSKNYAMAHVIFEGDPDAGIQF